MWPNVLEQKKRMLESPVDMQNYLVSVGWLFLIA